MFHFLIALTLWSSSTADSAFQTVEVAPGQTLSWLSFRLLGAYTPEIQEMLLADNPELRDPSLIRPGESLRFRRSLDRRALAPEKQISLAARRAVVTLVQGEAEVVRANGTCELLRANQFLSAGDAIDAKAESTAELVVDNQSVLRLLGPAHLSVVAMQTADPEDNHLRTLLHLSSGSIWAKVRRWAGPLVHFELEMPNAIAGVHGTVFEASVDTDGSSWVRVHEGEVGVRESFHSMREVKVSRDQEIHTSRQGMIFAPRPMDRRRSNWEKFNNDRDFQVENPPIGPRTGATPNHPPQTQDPGPNNIPDRADHHHR